MNRKGYSQQVMWAILITLLLVGCSAPAAKPTPIQPAETPTPTSGPLPGYGAEWIEITFDGNECTVSGPTELPTGEHSFVLFDLSEQNQEVWIARYLDGRTFQDLLDLQSEPGEYFLKPSWAVHPRRLGKSWDDSIGRSLYLFV